MKYFTSSNFAKNEMKYFFSIENKKCIFTELKDVLWLIVMVARSKSCVVVVKY